MGFLGGMFFISAILTGFGIAGIAISAGLILWGGVRRSDQLFHLAAGLACIGAGSTVVFLVLAIIDTARETLR